MTHIPAFSSPTPPRVSPQEHITCPLKCTDGGKPVTRAQSLYMHNSCIPHGLGSPTNPDSSAIVSSCPHQVSTPFPPQPTKRAPSHTAGIGLNATSSGAFPDHPLKQIPPSNTPSFYFLLRMSQSVWFLSINLLPCLLSVLSKIPRGQGPCSCHSHFITLEWSNVPGI